MQTLMRRCSILLVIALTAVAVGCAGGQKKADDKPTGPTVPSYFEEIPASTVYFFGGTEPVPEEFTRAAFEYLDGIAKASDDPGEPVEFLRSELGGELSPEGLATIGLSPTPRFATYAYGFNPMVRFSVADKTEFQGFVERFAQQYGVDYEEKTHDGKQYYLIDEGSDSIIYRFTASEFVMAGVADDDLEAFIPHFLGIKKPAESLAGQNEFMTMTERYGFERSIGGYFDLLKFAGINAGNIQMQGEAATFVENGPMKVDPPSHVKNGEVCLSELARIASWTPRLVMGFRTYSDEEVDVAFGAQLDPELAKEMVKARGEVPGYGSALMENALVSIGLGVDVGGLINAGGTWARQVQQEPFQCRDLDDFNIYAQQIIAMGGQSPPAISGLQGYSALLESVRVKYDDTNGAIYEPSLVTALRSSDPESLMMFASQMAPMLQSLQLKAGGEPVVVEPLNQAYPGLVESTALMTNEFIALAFGPGMSDKLSKMLKGEKDEQPPFLTMRARTGEAVSTITADLRKIIENATVQQPPRNLTEEEIALAGKYVDRVEGVMPDGQQTFEFSVTLDEDTVFFNYADSGPDFEDGWLEQFDSESQREFRALMRVLGAPSRPSRSAPPTAVEARPRETEEAPAERTVEEKPDSGDEPATEEK